MTAQAKPRSTGSPPRAIEDYHWPGNIRELVNVIERACSFAESDTIEIEDLPENVCGRDARAQITAVSAMEAGDSPEGRMAPSALRDMAFKEAKEEWISSFERDYIVALLERNDNNISHAAREAEIDRKYFRKLMKKYQIET